MIEVPDFVRTPFFSGLPEVGRTLIFSQVSVFALLDWDVWVKVMVEEVTTVGKCDPEGALLMFLLALGFPLSKIVTYGLVVSNSKSGGVLRTKLPDLICPPALSSMVGPVKLVNTVPVVSAEIVSPPVAGGTLTPTASVNVAVATVLPPESMICV